MRRCVSSGRTGQSLASGRCVRPGFICLVWPREDRVSHAKIAKHSLAQFLVWPADESVRTLPCHRLPRHIKQDVLTQAMLIAGATCVPRMIGRNPSTDHWLKEARFSE